MRFVPRSSVGVQLTFAVLLAIVCSWVLSSGMASYVAYRRFAALRQEMLARPDLYPAPIPEHSFGIRDFLFGPGYRLGPPPRPSEPSARPGSPPGPQAFEARPPDDRGPGPMPPRPGPPPGGDPWAAIAGSRIVIALLLAVIAGAWLSRRFSRPLGRLANGASAFESGNLGYRIPVAGGDEFAHVANAMNAMAERVAGQIGRLEEDAAKRRQFLADVAHELRSPVTTLRTMAGALQDGLAEDPERQARAVNSLVNTSERLLHLVTDLLELARLDLKELPISRRPVDLRELAAGAVAAHHASALQAGVGLSDVGAGPPVMASIDPDRITQVLDNLLDNAISYAGEGAEIRVRVDGGDPARITVSDTGRGISEEHLPYLFEPFYRADAARTPGSSHIGLGLRIARGLVGAHGGDLSITSADGIGTVATISLPQPSS